MGKQMLCGMTVGMLFAGNPDLDSEMLTAYEVGARVRLYERMQVA